MVGQYTNSDKHMSDNFVVRFSKIVLVLVRSELSEMFLIFDRESLFNVSFSCVKYFLALVRSGFFCRETRAMPEKDVIIIIESPEGTRLV